MEKLKEQYGEIIRYLVVGVLTTVVSLAVYYGLVTTVLDPENGLQLQAANVIAWVAAVTFAYVTNKVFVFRSHGGNVLHEAGAFFAARVGTLLMDMGIMFVTVTLCGMNDKIAKLIVQVVVTVANYIFSKLFVFRKSE
ncbi:MAG: GtrA family protein [Clostridium sp.]|nr:GtrA family protein [Clostridium sp.]MBO6149662.1 GtrA family protein [Clostridium sp.]